MTLESSIEHARRRKPDDHASRVLVIVADARSGTTVLGRALDTVPGLTHLGEVFHSVRGTEEEKKAVENLYLRPSANYFNYYEKLVRGHPSLSVPTPEARQDTLRRYLDFLCLQWPNMFVTIDVKYD